MALVAAVAILAVDTSPLGRYLLRLPAVITVAVGQEQGIRLDVPGFLAVRAEGRDRGLVLDGHRIGSRWRRLPGDTLQVRPAAAGDYTLRLRPWGLIPWPPLRIRAVGVPRVSVGGQSIGLVLTPPGPLVVAEPRVPTFGGAVRSPGAAAGVQLGADILAVAGQPPLDTAQVAAVTEEAGRSGASLPLEVLQRGIVRTRAVYPAYDVATHRYSLGLTLQRAVSGIGTLTFYDVSAQVFGALGHIVVDETTGRPVVPATGQLLPSFVAGVQPSRDGFPGEKLGVLLAGAPPLGTVRINTTVGIFGRLLRVPVPGPVAEPLAVALADQVHPGPATLLTVVHGGVAGAFAVRVLQVDASGPAGGKGLVVQVTDPRLLRTSGGIVQGMSGSPIVQGGRLVGALTHVYVNDPARGYGVLAEWMAKAAGLSGPD